MRQDFVNPIQDANANTAVQQFMSRVYGWMVGGLLVTTITAYYVASSLSLMLTISNYMLLLILAELGLVIALSAAIGKMSKNVAMGCFLLYSFLNGLTLSVILYMYTETSIYSTFFVTAGMFGALSLYGASTKKNLSGMGTFMFMGLVGIILAMIVNAFLQSSAIGFAITFLGVIIFAGLTAYDTQKIREMHQLVYQDDEMAAKGAIFGALTLYLDFINLFLFLLRLFGSRR